MGLNDRIENSKDVPFDTITVTETTTYGMGGGSTAHLHGVDGRLPRHVYKPTAVKIWENHGIDVMNHGISVCERDKHGVYNIISGKRWRRMIGENDE